MRSAKTNSLVIQTPEGIVFSLLIADPITRFLAWSIDLLCILGITSLIGSLIVAGFSWISFDVARAIHTVIYFLLFIGYPIVMEWYWRGQTLGKRLLRLRVIDAQGMRLHLNQIVIRNLLRFIDVLPFFYMAGGLAALLNKHGQRLGDLAANTIVVRQPPTFEPDLDQIMAGKYNSFREFPHLAARLRQRLSPEEASIALQALLRRNELDAEARVELFGEITSHLRTVVEFPPETAEGLTDEQYVLNCADILFRRDQSRAKERAKQPVAAQ